METNSIISCCFCPNKRHKRSRCPLGREYTKQVRVLQFIIFVKVHLNMVNYGIYIRIEQRINREGSCLNLRTSKDFKQIFRGCVGNCNLYTMCVFVGFFNRKTLGELSKSVTPFNASAHSRTNRFNRHLSCKICRAIASNNTYCNL